MNGSLSSISHSLTKLINLQCMVFALFNLAMEWAVWELEPISESGCKGKHLIAQEVEMPLNKINNWMKINPRAWGEGKWAPQAGQSAPTPTLFPQCSLGFMETWVLPPILSPDGSRGPESSTVPYAIKFSLINGIRSFSDMRDIFDCGHLATRVYQGNDRRNFNC